MKKFVLIAVCSLAFAREDPFTPVITPRDSVRPYYGESRVFDSAKIELPSSARLIRKVEVTFQNIDGSLQTRSIEVRGRIDWRMPLTISQTLDKKQSSPKNKTPKANPKNAESKSAESNESNIAPKNAIDSPESQTNITDSRVDSTDDLPKSKETIVRESEEGARDMRITGDKIANSQVMDLALDSAQKAQDSALDSRPKAQNADLKTQDLALNSQPKEAQKTQFAQDSALDSPKNSPQKTQNITQTTQDSSKKQNAKTRQIAPTKAQKQDFVQDLDIETALMNLQDSAQISAQNAQDLAQIAQDSAQDSAHLPNIAQDSQVSRTKKAQSPKTPPYSIENNSIFIRYKGDLIRHYIMQNPYRIVLDFKISANDYRKNTYNINAPYFKRLRYGLHTNFLRVVLELDGSYVYDLEKHGDGVKIYVE